MVIWSIIGKNVCIKEDTMAHLSEAAVAKINEICDRYKDEPTPLIMILSDIQREYGYIPLEVQVLVSQNTGISVAEIYGVVTFYSFFSLKPKGKYVVSCCLGTACYVKGAQQVIDKFSEILGVKPGETTSHTVSWTNIGWPCASVAIPLVLEEGVPLPSIVQRGENDKSWLCNKSIEQKKKVFSLKRGNVRDYIDLSKLVNAAGTGIVQRTMPLEREVLNHGRDALKNMRKGKGAQALRKYYEWVDEYVKEHYPEL